jgi:hypothetical protein
MWWIVFTAVDLYIGLVILKTVQPSVPPEKQKRLKIAEQVILGLLGLTAIAFLAKLFHFLG